MDLDTFQRLRSGYMFVTNPLGAKLESRFEEGGGNVRPPSNVIGTERRGPRRANERRGRAELAIPISPRSPDVPVQNWCINFFRNICGRTSFDSGRRSKAIASCRSASWTVTGYRFEPRLTPLPYVTGAIATIAGVGVEHDPLKIGADVITKQALGLRSTHGEYRFQQPSGRTAGELTRLALFFPEKRTSSENSVHRRVAGPERLMDPFFSRTIA